MQTMNVSLTPELIKIVQSKVESGLYGNASEVIREAIRQMDQSYELKRDRLKRALALGLEDIKAGRTVPHDKGFLDRSEARARKLLKDGKELSKDIM